MGLINAWRGCPSSFLLTLRDLMVYDPALLLHFSGRSNYSALRPHPSCDAGREIVISFECSWVSQTHTAAMSQEYIVVMRNPVN